MILETRIILLKNFDRAASGSEEQWYYNNEYVFMITLFKQFSQSVPVFVMEENLNAFTSKCFRECVINGQFGNPITSKHV